MSYRLEELQYVYMSIGLEELQSCIPAKFIAICLHVFAIDISLILPIEIFVALDSWSSYIYTSTGTKTESQKLC